MTLAQAHALLDLVREGAIGVTTPEIRAALEVTGDLDGQPMRIRRPVGTWEDAAADQRRAEPFDVVVAR